MATVFVKHTVADFDAWKPHFDDHANVREQYGEQGYTLYTDAENPTEVTILFEWDSAENAQKFIDESDLKEVMQEAGVVGDPEIQMLDEVEMKTRGKPPV
jgi:quinol monooxygenase YgiN